MALEFEKGDLDHPRGHAIVYFRDRSEPDRTAATYLVILPVSVDLAKYVPPFLAGHIPDMGEGGMSAFAFPPAPERVESYAAVLRLAEQRDDDLIFGGNRALEDAADLMGVVGEIVSEYAARYEESMKSGLPAAAALADADGGEDDSDDTIDDVLYGLMNEADRLGELTRLVGRLRYATEGDDEVAAREAAARVRGLGKYMPPNRRLDRLLASAIDRSPSGGRLAQLYLERAYCLLREDYLRVKAIDEQIRALETRSEG